jgi:phage shock protein PspC (stress-responsive transcriptional regulator)
MTTPPTDTSTEAPGDATGPRVSGEQMRNLGLIRRSGADRKIAGVAGGIARHLDIDPLLVRVVLVVMVFFGGSGILMYAAGWLLIPDEDSQRAAIHLDDRTRTIALWIVAACSGLAFVGDSLGQWHFPWPLAAVGLVVLAVLSRTTHHGPWTRPDAGTTTSTPPPPPPPPSPPSPSYAGYRPPVQRDPRRRGPILFGFTLALAALGIGALITADLAGADVPPSAYAAVVVGSCGLMLVVSAWFGRGGGLIPVGLVALVAMLLSSIVGDWHGGRILDRPTTAAAVDGTYRMGVGELRLDLTQVSDPAALDGRTVHVDGRVGHLVVIVPATGLDVRADATIDGAGETVLFGTQHDGSNGAFHDGGSGVPTLAIDADLLFGQIEIKTEAAR